MVAAGNFLPPPLGFEPRHCPGNFGRFTAARSPDGLRWTGSQVTGRSNSFRREEVGSGQGWPVDLAFSFPFPRDPNSLRAPVQATTKQPLARREALHKSRGECSCVTRFEWHSQKCLSRDVFVLRFSCHAESCLSNRNKIMENVRVAWPSLRPKWIFPV